MGKPGWFGLGLGVYNGDLAHLPARLGVGVGVSNFVEGEGGVVHEGLENAVVHEAGDSSQNGAVVGAPHALKHRNQHEDQVEAEAFVVGGAEVEVDLETRGRDHIDELLEAIRDAGYEVEVLV